MHTRTWCLRVCDYTVELFFYTNNKLLYFCEFNRFFIESNTAEYHNIIIMTQFSGIKLIILLYFNQRVWSVVINNKIK